MASMNSMLPSGLADRLDLDGVDAEDGHLGWVDDRGEGLHPEAPQVGHRKRPPLRSSGDRPRHGLGGQLFDPPREGGE